ncbi:uncharacterized protein LOC115228606 [Octopus sinensis]|uniref:Uncharacterized protein LOC115228606 n=1 Tax=Octopus sinensis TaxID=2607531 RepID=A0A6P7TTF2_9MOLL|nr:uncharacterized protein LOC115228606 [Octopus sinensis]
MADKFGRSVRQCEDWVDLKAQELASFDQQCDYLSASIVIKRMELLQAEISLREPINLTLKSQVEYFSQQNYNLDPQVLQRFRFGSDLCRFEDYNCKWGELVDKYAEISHKFSTFRIVEALSARIDNLNQEMDCIMANLSSFSFRNVKQIDALNDDSATLAKELDWTESCLAVLREDYEKVDNNETDKFGEQLNGLESRMSTMREIMSVRTGKLRELQDNFELSQSANEFYYWLQQQLLLSTDNGDSVESTMTLINELKVLGVF